jgi:riboflavin synthase
MFSGIVEEIGVVTSRKIVSEGIKFRVRSNKVIKKLRISNSVCINGVCHTVTSRSKNEFEFFSIHETLKKTNLGLLKVGEGVNLENSLTMGQELGGHFVLGHVDCTGELTAVKQVNTEDKSSKNWEYWVKIDKKHRQFIIYVGSIAINGVSLTVAEIKKTKGSYFEVKVAIIPYTYDNTNFGTMKKGDKVNLEFDFLGKYVLNAMSKPKLVK